MAELQFNNTHYEGPVLDGYRSEVDEEDLEHILIASREHIYSHPIQTLVQEYINNGKDANRSAGKPDNAMDITVPIYNNMEFVVRDYGVGLSKDEIIQVYRKIGKSTKRKDNTLAGKYGVGAKIGFVYTDAFLITSWKNGRKVECLAHKANSQIGDYTFLSDVETTEPNGVQISIKLTNASHIAQFKHAIQRIFFLWSEKPKFNIDMQWPVLKYDYFCTKVFSSDKVDAFSLQFINNHGLWLDVDGTPYKVSDSIANRCGIKLDFYFKAVYITATLSDVDIPMNREELTTNNKLESFLKYHNNLETARVDIINKVSNRDDYTNILEIKNYIMSYKESFKVEQIEIYAKIINRKITYDNGWFYLEPKEEDLFNHFFAHERENHTESRTKFGTNNIFCEKVSTYCTNKIKRHPHNKSSHTVWTIPYGTMFPEDIWKFCNLRDYYDMFPKKAKKIGVSQKTSSDVTYYTYYNGIQRESKKRELFLEINSIEKPIYYSLFANNKSSNESILSKYGYLYDFDLKTKGAVLGLIPKNLKTLKSWGYDLICIDSGYIFSNRIYNYLRKSVCYNKLDYRCVYANITSDLDPDIRYLKDCYKQRSNSLSYNLLPHDLKIFVNEEELKIKNAKENADRKYPFIKHIRHEIIGGFDAWISSYLIPLLLSNPQVEQNKLEEPIIALN